MTPNTTHALPAAIALAALSLLSSCNQEEPVRVYEVILPPGGGKAAAKAPGPMANSPAMGAAAAVGAASVKWETPAGWEAQPLTDLINRGHFLWPEIAGSRPVFTISAYPGEAGGVLPNVNRWRRQLGLEALEGAAMEREITPVNAAGAVILTCHLEGAQGAMAGGVLSLPGETWFFKLTGSKEAVAAAKPEFLRFLSSLQVGGRSASTQPPATPGVDAAPAGNGSASGVGPSASAPADQSAKPTYEVPTGWREMPGNSMRTASFMVPGPDNHNADISLLKLSGGTDLQNANMWRQQLGLPALTESDLGQAMSKETIGSREVRWFDAGSTEKSLGGAFRQRIVAAIFEDKGTVWVARMKGEHQHLEQEKENLRAFLSSLRFP